MSDLTMIDHLEMRWLPVVDQSGRAHMEACWISVPATPLPQTAPVHAA